MKVLIYTLFLFIGSSVCLAECGDRGIWVWPNQTEIKANSLFLVTGYASDQEVIKQLNSSYPIYLQSKTEKISLTVERIVEGNFSLTQAILKPNRPLTSGETYTLCIEGQPYLEKFIPTRYNSRTRKHETVEWEVSDDIDTEPPVWDDPPAETGKSLIYYGCGPSIYVRFSCDVSDESEFLVKATLTSKASKKTSTYYLIPKEEFMQVGHGMCSGEFDFDEGEDYLIEFSLVDASGNEDASKQSLEFTKPITESRFEDE